MPATARFDRTLRAVMWLDALLSFVVAMLAIVAIPLLALLGFPRQALLTLGLIAIAGALVLAACGAVTAVLLTLRMQDGDYGLPPGLRLPLPRQMRALAPDPDARA